MIKELTIYQAELIHNDQILEYKGIDGIKERGLFEYTIEKPYQIIFGREFYPSLFDKAAYYLVTFSIHQYFNDANKRTASAYALTLLKLNGYTIKHTDMLYQIACSISDQEDCGEINDEDSLICEIATLLKQDSYQINKII